MSHDYAVFGAIGTIGAITIVALLLGAANGLVAAAITTLGMLGGIKVALKATQQAAP